jgi:hypothetical protein
VTVSDREALWKQLLAEVKGVMGQRGLFLPTPETPMLRQPPSLPWGIWRGSLEEVEAFDDRELPVNTTTELIGQGLVAVFRYLLVLHNPEVWAVEQQHVSTWLDELASLGSGQPRRSVEYRYSRSLTTPRRGWLSCEPTVSWVLTPHARHPGCGQVRPRGESCDTGDLSHEVRLYFLHGNPDARVPPRQRFDVLLRPGGERERLPLSRKIRKGLNPRPYERAAIGLSVPLVDKRLYLPERLSSPSDVRAAVQDMYALLCLYLVQEEFVRLDEDRGVLEFLEAYLHQFKGAKQIGIRYALGEILAHYQIPEDYRAVRKYVAKTIRGLLTNQLKREAVNTIERQAAARAMGLPEPEHPDPAIPGALTIPEAAATLGIPVRSLYDRVKPGRIRGKMRVQRVAVDNQRLLTIPEAEIDNLTTLLVQEQLRKDLVAALEAGASLKRKSALRWVERQEAKGLALEEIRRRVQERLKQTRGKDPMA